MKELKTWCRFAILALVITFLLSLTACGKGTTDINSSPTDTVSITKINSYVTAADLRAGVKKTNNYMAAVKMSHKKHEDAGVPCFTCHHKKGNDERIKQCAYCHKGKKGDGTMHQFCITCHLDRKKGPSMCQDCHKLGVEN